MSKRVLISIDFINEIVHPEGKLAAKFIPNIVKNDVIENANLAIDKARINNIQIIHVKVGFSANYIECPNNSPIFSNAKQYNALELGKWGTEIYSQIDVKANDHILIKHRISAFYNTDLECVLRANNIKDIIIMGVSTDMAVELTAREAHDRDYNVTVIEDACTTYSEAAHLASINNISRIATVKSAKQWLS
ncbi:cysteine hydrolase [Allofrancisella guangzhouensis]|uniref:Isochorismatase n=1 Tax=Allofrancisella guangzhouensis TaxID=594679 RepID=A0A0A8E5X2_9GAMM|nr:isochorismatase family cysteine hydrolase [Allofrancisella guangzhouensis]AJC48997.1 isochorismatase [Allofrancisella guangzhouensis]MBK2027902.1 cysteine hydrolase [Allofrancisella guangzhouensis]MBK2044155.1 cysteine hydrolase [Allofrancisella guangzhouensis]MBK2045135.1 cysteine hydrolase [Allofrancisella guangzhouensis]